MGYFIGWHSSTVFFMNIFHNCSELMLIGNLLCMKYCSELSGTILILPAVTWYRQYHDLDFIREKTKAYRG